MFEVSEEFFYAKLPDRFLSIYELNVRKGENVGMKISFIYIHWGNYVFLPFSLFFLFSTCLFFLCNLGYG